MICLWDQDLHTVFFQLRWVGGAAGECSFSFFFSKNKITIWGIDTQFIGDNLGIVFMKLGFGYIFGSCCLAWRRYRPNVWDQRLGSFGPPGRNWSAKTWLFAQWKASMEWPWGCSDGPWRKKHPGMVDPQTSCGCQGLFGTRCVIYQDFGRGLQMKRYTSLYPVQRWLKFQSESR